MTPKTQFAAESKASLTQYESDKKLCNDETSSNARLQCRRDAKAEYDKALAEAKARLAATSPPGQPAAQPASVAALCADCGKVIAVSETKKAGEGSALGVIAGGAAGALLGNQMGSGSGKDLTTIVGAVGGAYAGKKLEERAKTHTIWSVSVQYGDGSKASFDFDRDPGFKVGDTVKKSGNTIVK